VKLGKHSLFLGHDWLKLHNPSIDWKSGDVIFDKCPTCCETNIKIRDLEFEGNDDTPLRNFGKDKPLNLEEGD
jgi:hypothetical protein